MEKHINLGKLLILGDSYSTFEGYMPQGCGSYYRPSGEPETDVRRVEDTWWCRLISLVECELVLNHSWTGSTLCNTGYDGMDFTDRSFISRFDKLIEEGFFQKNTVDTMLILGGTNDTWAGSPIGEPKWENWNKEDLYHVAPACAYLMHQVRQMLPNARVCFILNTDLSADVVCCVRLACEKQGAEVLPLTEVEKIEGHPTVEGMKDISLQVMTYFMKSM